SLGAVGNGGGPPPRPTAGGAVAGCRGPADRRAGLRAGERARGVRLLLPPRCSARRRAAHARSGRLLPPAGGSVARRSSGPPLGRLDAAGVGLDARGIAAGGGTGGPPASR